MSPSWIERLRGPRAVGFALGRHSVEMASARGKAAAVESTASAALAVPLFIGAPTPEAEAALEAALRAVGAPATGRHVPVHVSLPDAAVRCAVFDLDALPRRRADRHDLVRLRFGHAGLACAWQPLGRQDDGRHRLLGLGMDAAWQRCIEVAFARAGIVPWSLSTNACRRFNQHHAALGAGGDGGALACVDNDAWSLLVFDAQARLHHATSRWRGSDDALAIAAAVERCIVALLREAPALSVARLHVVADVHGQALADALDARLHDPCVRLEAEGAAAAALQA